MDNIVLSNEARTMENMEINVDAIDTALMPEMPEGVSAFLSAMPDKVY